MISLIASIAIATAAAPVAVPVRATVSRKDSKWRVEYMLPSRAKAWVFPMSAPTYAGLKPWRSTAWRVTSKGVRIERLGNYDALVGDGHRPLPRRLVIEFTPTSATLEREYDPAISFSDGSTAIYSDQFDLAPSDEPSSLSGKAYGFSVGELGGAPAAVTFRDGGKSVLVGAKCKIDPILTGAQTYVVFGGNAVVTSNGVTMLADPSLPQWLKEKASQFAPTVTTFYSQQLGVRVSPEMPLLLMGWRGATPGKVINDGGVRPGEVVLNFEGDGLLEPNQKAAQRTEWFIAHEVAHFWLGTSGVSARTRADEWITEGGAELAAFTLLGRSDPAYVGGELQRAVDDCVQRAGKPIAAAADRHDARSLYACGTVLGMAAGSLTDHTGRIDYLAFLRPLLDERRRDRSIGADEWFGHLLDVSRDRELVEMMRSLVDAGAAEPAGAVKAILDRAGLANDLVKGRIVLKPSASLLR